MVKQKQLSYYVKNYIDCPVNWRSATCYVITAILVIYVKPKVDRW